MQNIILYGVILLCGVAAISVVSEQARTFLKNASIPIFGFPSYSYWEQFENLKQDVIVKKIEEEEEESSLPPGSPVELYNNQPYHLLNDVMPPPRLNESLSCVNSRSCYAADFQRMVAKTGNYKQLTNNYKRAYPDSCSAPMQELVLNFYKTEPLKEM